MQKVTSRDTKADILRAYTDLAKEFKALQKQKGAPAPAGGGGGGGSDDDDGELSIDDIIGRLQGLTANIGESSSSLQTDLTAEATKLQSLRAQADGIIAELKNLHDIAVGPEILGQLIAQHQQTSEAADAEFSAKREAFEKEMSASRAAWKKEQDEYARKSKEAAAELKKVRQRNAAEYKYELEQRYKEQDDQAE
ncbi:MAG: hypothetical protein KDK70_25080, partial [Myxococcales bacterium]|nr:hypothetical protein [Myxococcales bacterium]